METNIKSLNVRKKITVLLSIFGLKENGVENGQFNETIHKEDFNAENLHKIQNDNYSSCLFIF